jgi:hypothetical protein
MLVRDVMTYNVATVPSAIPVFEAERLLESQELTHGALTVFLTGETVKICFRI